MTVLNDVSMIEQRHYQANKWCFEYVAKPILHTIWNCDDVAMTISHYDGLVDSFPI